jgi:hypothetical protein
MDQPTASADALEYVGLTTGFCRAYRSRAREARAADAFDDLLARALRRLGTTLVVPGRPGFVARAMAADDSLMLTVSGPVRVSDVTVIAPVAAFGAQAAAAGAEELWRVLHDDPGPGASEALVTRGGRPPRAPWVAARPLLCIDRCDRDTGWLDDFGVDVAWAWVAWRRRVDPIRP